MKPSEYLDKAKIALAIKSDYGLGKALKISNQRIADYYKSKAWPDAYACVQIALALKLDPLEVLADIESQSAKNEERRKFWEDFIGRTKRVAAVLLLALTFISISPGGKDGVYKAAMVASLAFLSGLMVRIMYIMLNTIPRTSKKTLQIGIDLFCAAK